MTTPRSPTPREAARVWWRIGFLSFGGPAAQIALMHREIVELRGWLSERQFLNALSFCMLLPGPEAMQLATYAGWRLHGVRGGLMAGLAFVLPGAAVILALALIYAALGDVPWVAALFDGLKAAVLVIVLGALIRVARKALTGMWDQLIALGAFVAIFFLAAPFPLIVVLAGLIGWWRGSAPDPEIVAPPLIPASQTARTVAIWGALWLVPLINLHLSAAPEVLAQLGRFFATLAVVTFGGAYAVLAYMAQDVVVQQGWLTAGEMIDALGLAETTPGPLILVTQFVGVLTGLKEGGVALGLAAGLVVLWVTFVPCFLWIFAGAPYIDWIADQPRLKSALVAITAAVVGVILNLSLWFGLHVLFDTVVQTHWGPLTLWWPDIGSLDLGAVAIFGLCCALAFGLRWGIGVILIVAAISGLALALLV